MSAPVAAALSTIGERVAAACARANRLADSTTLLAVSKLQPVSKIHEAYAAGQRDFGENYAQELRDKAAELASVEGLRWHAIGPLQTNKAKYVAKVAYAFHALDRVDVAKELSQRRQGKPLRCFVELNVAEEASKGGIRGGELGAFLDAVTPLRGLEIVGLMTLPPLSDDPEQMRPYFRVVRDLAQRHGLGELSMGTTADFEVAIEEGATIVRVGTAIFGHRPQP